MNQGPRWILLMKKNRAVKSRATVPLKRNLLNAVTFNYCYNPLSILLKNKSDLRFLMRKQNS